MTRGTVDLPTGPIEYRDSGGSGPTVLLVHGLMMNQQSLWNEVVDQMPEVRCVVPTLPLGAHSRPAGDAADLSLQGIARLLRELVEAMDLTDVTLVGNDTGGAVAQFLVADDHARIARLVLISCEAFENFPPGLTGRTVVAAGRLSPTLFGLFMQQTRLGAVRRSPLAFGWLTKRGDVVVKGWREPLRDASVRRDVVRMLRNIAKEGPALAIASEALAGFPKPALVVWAADDRIMPMEHAHRLAATLPDAQLEIVPDSYTLVPLDQPNHLATTLRRFVGGVRP
ncbi:alpha/beta fold hydrolase [Actinomadura coerulea]|uniref:alpha/beta fold hydrolase n=1 Tax=Actinomadura coerulea TaxID=46159 RepID=UPI00343B3C29